MKKAYCDHCGKEIIASSDTNLVNVNILVNFASETAGGGGTEIDLCERCLKEFIYFVRKQNMDREVLKKQAEYFVK